LWSLDASSNLVVHESITGSSGVDPFGMSVFNGNLYFAGYTPEAGREMWKMNGSFSVTAMPELIAGSGDGLHWSGQGSGQPGFHAVGVGDQMYFAGRSDPDFGFELHRMTTGEVVTRLTDLNPGTGDGLPGGALFYSAPLNAILLSADNGTGGRELFAFDLASQSIRQVAELNPGAMSSSPHGFVAASGSGQVYFAAGDSDEWNPELYVTDGTAAGTRRVYGKDPDGSMNHNANARWLHVWNGSVYYSGCNLAAFTNSSCTSKLRVHRAGQFIDPKKMFFEVMSFGQPTLPVGGDQLSAVTPIP
jgi:ELWxxDGT repeat protein